MESKRRGFYGHPMSDSAVIGQDTLTSGELLRSWRLRRGLSQLTLALTAGVSTRHLSFIETGRARPSRELLAHLAICLDLPLRERNRFLLAAGYAPEHPERPYDHPDMEALRHALGLMLAGLEPNPVLVVDRTWNLLAANDAADLLTDGVDPGLLEPPVNVLRLAFHPGGLPRISVPSPACNLAFFQRLRRKSVAAADEKLARLLDELEGYLPGPDACGDPGPGGPLLGSFELATRLGGVRLFSVITTLGAPIEVTSADLAIETFLPADAESMQLLRRLAKHRSRSST
jgi:transcriptional regulator with XRE-family HTH domain